MPRRPRAPYNLPVIILATSTLLWALWWVGTTQFLFPRPSRRQVSTAEAGAKIPPLLARDEILSERSAFGDDEMLSERSAFGDMFGGFNALLSALNFGLLSVAMLQQSRETKQQNVISRWRANYDYLVEAKKLIASRPAILQMHGVSETRLKELLKSGITAEEIAYVVLDLKAADLFYRMASDETILVTEYRTALLNNARYSAILKVCIDEPAQLLPDGVLLRYLKTAVKSSSDSVKSV